MGMDGGARLGHGKLNPPAWELGDISCHDRASSLECTMANSALC